MQARLFVLELLLIRADSIGGRQGGGDGPVTDRLCRRLRPTGDQNHQEDNGRDTDHQPHLKLPRQHTAGLLAMILE
jgi:hypothetical protein